MPGPEPVLGFKRVVPIIYTHIVDPVEWHAAIIGKHSFVSFATSDPTGTVSNGQLRLTELSVTVILDQPSSSLLLLTFLS